MASPSSFCSSQLWNISTTKTQPPTNLPPMNTCGDDGQFVCHRADGADLFQVLAQRIDFAPGLFGATDDERRLCKACRLGAEDSFVIEECAAALHGTIQLIPRRVVDHAHYGDPIGDQGDGNNELRNACEELFGTVNRIDDPNTLVL